MIESNSTFMSENTSHHGFVVNILNHIKNELSKRTTWLNGGKGHLAVVPLEGMEEFAAGFKLKPIPLEVSPLSRLSSWSFAHRSSEIEKSVEGVWRYVDKNTDEDVFFGNVNYFICDYSIMSAPLSFVFAETEEQAVNFVKLFKKSKADRNKNSLPCILSSEGKRISDFRKMKWEDIFLSGTMLADIKSEVDGFFDSKALYDKYNLHWRRGILLTGKPGDGKTSICRAIASTVSCPTIFCTLNKGDVFGLLDEISETIAENAPCVAIFEDADSIGANASTRSCFLNMLDGMCSVKGVLAIATTNCPEKLDAAFTGRPSRFDSLYIISDPTSVEIEKIIRNKLGELASKITPEAMKPVLDSLSGLSAAAAQEAATFALLSSLKTKTKISAKTLLESAIKVRKHMVASQEGKMEDSSKTGGGFCIDEE